MPEPKQDAAFETLVADWATLGLDKHEGLGLLHKEGGITGLFELLRVETPRVAAALGHRLAVEDAFGLALYLEAMSAPTRAERLARLNAQDLGDPMTWEVALAQLDPPMPKRFRHAIEAWIDRARAVERRSNGIVEAPKLAVGSRVRHAAFGEGVVSALQDTTATVEFAAGIKKLRADKLELV
jgi:hypothetical protein